VARLPLLPPVLQDAPSPEPGPASPGLLQNLLVREPSAAGAGSVEETFDGNGISSWTVARGVGPRGAALTFWPRRPPPGLPTSAVAPRPQNQLQTLPRTLPPPVPRLHPPLLFPRRCAYAWQQTELSRQRAPLFGTWESRRQLTRFPGIGHSSSPGSSRPILPPWRRRSKPRCSTRCRT